jgi:hypothetical protein
MGDPIGIGKQCLARGVIVRQQCRRECRLFEVRNVHSEGCGMAISVCNHLYYATGWPRR